MQVQDTGPGMSADLITRLFRPYVQVQLMALSAVDQLLIDSL